MSNIIETLKTIRAYDVIKFIQDLSAKGGIDSAEYRHDVEEVIHSSDNHEKVEILFFAGRDGFYDSFQVILVHQTYPRKIVSAWARSMPHGDAIKTLPNDISGVVQKRVLHRRVNRGRVAA